MTVNLEKAIIEKVHALSESDQQQVLALVDELLQSEQSTSGATDTRPIWEIFAELSAQVPADEWNNLPADGAANHDHYLYGSSKTDNR